MANLYTNPEDHEAMLRRWFDTAKTSGAGYMAIAARQFDEDTYEFTPVRITLETGEKISEKVYDVVKAPVHSLWDLNQSFDEQFQQTTGSPWSIPAEEERLQEEQLVMAEVYNEVSGIAEHERVATPSMLYSDPINHEQILRVWYDDAVDAGAAYLAVTVDRGDPGVYEFGPVQLTPQDQQRLLYEGGDLPNALFDVVGKNVYSLWDLRAPFDIQFQQQNGRPMNLVADAELSPGWEMHWNETLGLSKAQQETLLAHVKDHVQFLRNDLAITSEEAEREARPYDVLAAQLEKNEFQLTQENGALLRESFAVQGWGTSTHREPEHMKHLVEGIWTAQERPTESQVPGDSDGWGDPIPVEQLEEKTTFVDPEEFRADHARGLTPAERVRESLKGFRAARDADVPERPQYEPESATQTITGHKV